MPPKTPPKTIAEYIAQAPPQARPALRQVWRAVRSVAPKAEQVMAYGIPTLRLERNLVHFAGYAQHLGFYPTAAGITAFKPQLSKYKSARGSVQFPLDAPMPLALIKRITRFRVKMEAARAR